MGFQRIISCSNPLKCRRVGAWNNPPGTSRDHMRLSKFGPLQSRILKLRCTFKVSFQYFIFTHIFERSKDVKMNYEKKFLLHLSFKTKKFINPKPSRYLLMPHWEKYFIKEENFSCIISIFILHRIKAYGKTKLNRIFRIYAMIFRILTSLPWISFLYWPCQAVYIIIWMLLLT